MTALIRIHSLGAHIITPRPQTLLPPPPPPHSHARVYARSSIPTSLLSCSSVPALIDFMRKQCTYVVITAVYHALPWLYRINAGFSMSCNFVKSPVIWNSPVLPYLWIADYHSFMEWHNVISEYCVVASSCEPLDFFTIIIISVDTHL